MAAEDYCGWKRVDGDREWMQVRTRDGRVRALNVAPVRTASRHAQKAATRQQLLTATIDAIAEGGLADLTLSKITERAEVSRGLVNFHFDSKEQLLVDTLESLTLEYLESWKRALDRAGADPGAQLLAIVRNDFHPAICNRRKIAVWFAFRGEVKSRPTYLEVCSRADREFENAVTGIVGALIKDGGYDLDARAIATGLMSMTEGQWLDCIMYPQSFRREDGLATLMTFLAALFPRHFSAANVNGAHTRRPGAGA